MSESVGTTATFYSFQMTFDGFQLPFDFCSYISFNPVVVTMAWVAWVVVSFCEAWARLAWAWVTWVAEHLAGNCCTCCSLSSHPSLVYSTWVAWITWVVAYVGYCGPAEAIVAWIPDDHDFTS